MLELRKALERQFHDNLVKASKSLARKTTRTFTRKTEVIVGEWIERNCRGKRILDFCCGTGQWSLEFAVNGAHVYGIDISPRALECARETVVKAGYSPQAHFTLMDAERLAFRDQTFDLIFCAGALHHLDIRQAYKELARILKPLGEIMCIEPLRYNPFIAAYRAVTPELRTSWERAHILGRAEIDHAQRHFRRVETTFMHLATLLGAVLGKRCTQWILSVLEQVDGWILRMPFVRLLAWQVILVLAEPRRGAN